MDHFTFNFAKKYNFSSRKQTCAYSNQRGQGWPQALNMTFRRQVSGRQSNSCSIIISLVHDFVNGLIKNVNLCRQDYICQFGCMNGPSEGWTVRRCEKEGFIKTQNTGLNSHVTNIIVGVDLKFASNRKKHVGGYWMAFWHGVRLMPIEQFETVRNRLGWTCLFINPGRLGSQSLEGNFTRLFWKPPSTHFHLLNDLAI